MKSTAFIILSLLFISQVCSQEVQWRGPERNGRFPETGLMKSWPEGGPEMILKVEDIGLGYSSPVLYQGTVYVTGKKDNEDYFTAVDLNGDIKYQVRYGSSWDQSYPETRSTPTIEENKAYVISGMGEVVCLNIGDGSIIWSVNANENFKGELHRWGVAESPLVTRDKVIYTVGGDLTAVVALDKRNGELVWRTAPVGGARTYVSPILYENEDYELIIASTENDIIGIIPESGEIAWTSTFVPAPGTTERIVTINTNSAIYRDDEIFISKGYNMFGVMLKVGPDIHSVQEKWRTDVLDTHHGHYVYEGPYLYGSNWLSNSQGNWVCLDWETGKVMYEEEWNTKGSIAYADGMLYCYEERRGHVALVNPTPEKFDVVSSFRIEEGSGPHWAHPYIVDKKMLIRHGDVLMVFDIENKDN